MTDHRDEPPADEGFDPEHDPDDDGWDDRLKDTASAFRKKFGKRVRSVFNEDVIRGAVADAVPKELFGYVMKTADSAKDEVVRITGVQIRKFLENLDIGGEMQKVLTAVSFEVRTTVRFVPNAENNRVSPDSEVSVGLKRGDKEVEVTASPKKAKAMREGLRGAVDGVMKTFAGDEEEEGEVKKRWNAMRSGLFAAVDTVVGAFDRDEEEGRESPSPATGSEADEAADAKPTEPDQTAGTDDSAVGAESMGGAPSGSAPAKTADETSDDKPTGH